MVPTTHAGSETQIATAARRVKRRVAWLPLIHAQADDRAEVSTSVFAEKRDGNKGNLTVVHPQADFGVDLGRYVSLDAS